MERVFATPADAVLAERARAAGVEVVVVSAEIIARLSTTETPQSPVAVVAVGGDEIPGDGDVLVAWGVGDPGNVGTLIRTAAAFGWGFVAGPETADPWSPKALRAGAGGHFRVPIGRCASLEELGGRLVVATVAVGGDPPEALGGADPLAVVVGDEAKGLPESVVAAAGARVTIAMPGGTESLNAAVAGAIVVYEASRRRTGR